MRPERYRTFLWHPTAPQGEPDVMLDFRTRELRAPGPIRVIGENVVEQIQPHRIRGIDLGFRAFTYSTNYVTCAHRPADQTIEELPAGIYTFWGSGHGHCTIEAAGARHIYDTALDCDFLDVDGLVFDMPCPGPVSLRFHGTWTWAQIDRMPFPTPRIPTGTVPKTRQPDFAFTMLDELGLEHCEAMTAAVLFWPTQMATGGTMLTFDDGSVRNRIAINYKVEPTAQAGATWVVEGAEAALDPLLPFEVRKGQWNAMAVSWEPGRVSVCLNGGGQTSISDATLPAGLQRLIWGSDVGFQPLNGFLGRVHLCRRAMPADDLVQVSEELFRTAIAPRPALPFDIPKPQRTNRLGRLWRWRK